MIQNGKNLKLNNINNALPNMSNTISGWFLNITLQVVDRVMDGAEWVEGITKTINTKGVVQPLTEEQLKILPEGTRTWEWLMLHCLPNVDLNTNQFIKYDGVKYKIMSKKDYTKYGYIQYTLLEAYRTNG